MLYQHTWIRSSLKNWEARYGPRRNLKKHKFSRIHFHTWDHHDGTACVGHHINDNLIVFRLRKGISP